MNLPQTRNLLCLTIVLLSWVKADEKCSNPPYIYNYLATNTPYRTIANCNTTEIKYEGCEATKLWALIRHGTRNPNVEVIGSMDTRLPEIRDQILENAEKGKNKIRNSDAKAFNSWKNKVDTDDDKKLTDEGKDEIMLLAERMQKRFPGILDNVYSNSSYYFKYTDTKRTKKSAKYFTTGLFGMTAADTIEFPEALKADPILRFYKLCPKWLKEVHENPDALIERTKFEQSDVVTATVQEINERLGFTDELTFDDVDTMYTVCAFETAWNTGKRSPWCSPFTVDNFKVLEYAEDLKDYWIDGYGYELTYKQACPAFNDMVNYFEDKDPSPKASKATVYFTHSGTLSKMLAHMGLYKQEEPLTADNFQEQDNRSWRDGKIDSFATNLFFVLFDCQGEQKILTLHQEQVVRLPSCPQDDLCGVEQIKQYYADSIPCLFDEMCENSS